MGWYLRKSNRTNYYVLESTVTGRVLKEGTRQEVMSYMKKGLIRHAKEGIADGGILVKGGSIRYTSDKNAKQNISIPTYVTSTIKNWFRNVEKF